MSKGYPFERLNRLQPGTVQTRGAAEPAEHLSEEDVMAQANASRREPSDARSEPPPPAEPAPWWTRAPVADPAGDPSSPRASKPRQNDEPSLARPPLMGVPADQAVPAPADVPPTRLRSVAAAVAAPAPAPAPAARHPMPAGGNLGQALHQELSRLEGQRAALEAERDEIEERIAAVDARVGHVEALLAGERSAGPPAELPSIGSRRSDGSADSTATAA